MEDTYTARAEVTIDALPAIVWQALINPDLIAKYLYGTRTETTWKVGDPITFAGDYNGQRYEDKGTVLEFEPRRKLSYSYWSSMSGTPDIPQNYSTVSFIVASIGSGGTHLVVTQEKIRDEKTCRHCEEAWKTTLGTLKRVAEDAARLKAF